jgi:hypothetical protein
MYRPAVQHLTQLQQVLHCHRMNNDIALGLDPYSDQR